MPSQDTGGSIHQGGAPAFISGSGASVSIDDRTLKLTNLDRVLYPDGCTKAEVIDYYLHIAPVLLPHLAGRPVTRQRWPEGTAKAGFYEKNVPGGAPDWVPTLEVIGADGTVNYVLVDEPATLVWLANLAALELHAPQWRHDRQPDASGPVLIDADHDPLADQLVIDLDPGAGVGGPQIAEAALLIAATLAEDGIIASPKTSGSKGIQLYAPVQPAPATRCEAYVHALAESLVAAHPNRFVLTMNKDARAGHIYLDFMQNRAARNTIAPYSLRGRTTPTVSTPLTWDEVGAATTADALPSFTPADVLDRVATHGDLFDALISRDHAAEVPAG